jgi:glycosyltransferase involved in cell wall biosynthesis
MHVNQSRPGISIVIPARNEEKNLQHLLPLIPYDIEEIILVNGRSTDNTVAVARSLRPDIRIIEQVGKGKGDAMRLGFAACTQDIIVMLDADGSADPAEIPAFVDALLKGGDFAKGSRFLAGGGSKDLTLLRSLGNLGLCGLVNLLFKKRFTDLCYGYNVFWRYCLDRVTLDCDGFDIETQLCLRMHKAGFKLVEVPSMEHTRLHGESNLNTFRDGWLVLKVILREWRNRHSGLPVREPKEMYNTVGASLSTSDAATYIEK